MPFSLFGIIVRLPKSLLGVFPFLTAHNFRRVDFLAMHFRAKQ